MTMSLIEGFFEALFGETENGPCSQCEHEYQRDCHRFYEEKYSRVDGTSRVYDSCEEARSSNGFCGHHGKYWERYVPQSESSSSSTSSLNDNGYHDNW